MRNGKLFIGLALGALAGSALSCFIHSQKGRRMRVEIKEALRELRARGCKYEDCECEECECEEEDCRPHHHHHHHHHHEPKKDEEVIEVVAEKVNAQKPEEASEK